MKARRRESGSTSSDDRPKPKPQRRINLKDADNFLKLASAMKILLSRSVTQEELERAKELLQEYLVGFLEVRVISYVVYGRYRYSS